MGMARMASKKGGRKSWELVQSLSGKSFHPSEGGALSSKYQAQSIIKSTIERGHVHVVKSMLMKK